MPACPESPQRVYEYVLQGSACVRVRAWGLRTRGEVQRCVPPKVPDVWVCTVAEEQPKDIMLVLGAAKVQRRPLLVVRGVDVDAVFQQAPHRVLVVFVDGLAELRGHAALVCLHRGDRLPFQPGILGAFHGAPLCTGRGEANRGPHHHYVSYPRAPPTPTPCSLHPSLPTTTHHATTASRRPSSSSWLLSSPVAWPRAWWRWSRGSSRSAGKARPRPHPPSTRGWCEQGRGRGHASLHARCRAVPARCSASPRPWRQTALRPQGTSERRAPPPSPRLPGRGQVPRGWAKARTSGRTGTQGRGHGGCSSVGARGRGVGRARRRSRSVPWVRTDRSMRRGQPAVSFRRRVQDR